jgi:hypothetical protein
MGRLKVHFFKTVRSALERDTYGHTPPSHHSRPQRGPLPLAVGEGILPLAPEDVQVEAPQECLAHPPWACGRGAW